MMFQPRKKQVLDHSQNWGSFGHEELMISDVPKYPTKAEDDVDHLALRIDGNFCVAVRIVEPKTGPSWTSFVEDQLPMWRCFDHRQTKAEHQRSLQRADD